MNTSTTLLAGRGRRLGRTKRPTVAKPVYLSRVVKRGSDVYQSDHGQGAVTQRARWVLATCLAGVLGLAAFGFLMRAAIEPNDEAATLAVLTKLSTTDMLASLTTITAETLVPASPMADRERTRVGASKTDRLVQEREGEAIRYIVRTSAQDVRDGRPFISLKPYARVVARLGAELRSDVGKIPPFRPLELYRDAGPVGASQSTSRKQTDSRNTSKIVELEGGRLASTDGRALSDAAVLAIVQQLAQGTVAASEAELPEIPNDVAANGDEVLADGWSVLALENTATTITLAKNVRATQNRVPTRQDNVSRQIHRVRQGDSLIGLLRRAGAEAWQAVAIVEAAKTSGAPTNLGLQDELHLTLVPSPADRRKLEPTIVSLFGEGQTHRFTVTRTDDGNYAATDKPAQPVIETARTIMAASGSTTKAGPQARIYDSVYAASRRARFDDAFALQLMRTFAYDVDFNRAVAPGDMLELFFDIERPDDTDGRLLFAALTIGGETKGFYRFRARDGSIDFYDEDGNSAKVFLLRKPVRGADVRFTSGFGMRMHPILRRRKMHTGADWGARTGTPILAAGNGTIVKAGRKGGYGNHVRIRHANGYETTYSHMSRYAKGVREGARVRLGQVIGYVGSTGISSGPHLHYEVLVNKRFVDPMTINVPRGRKLDGRDLTDFQRERRRIDTLRELPPITVKVASSGTSVRAN